MCEQCAVDTRARAAYVDLLRKYTWLCECINIRPPENDEKQENILEWNIKRTTEMPEYWLSTSHKIQIQHHILHCRLYTTECLWCVQWKNETAMFGIDVETDFWLLHHLTWMRDLTFCTHNFKTPFHWFLIRPKFWSFSYTLCLTLRPLNKRNVFVLYCHTIFCEIKAICYWQKMEMHTRKCGSDRMNRRVDSIIIQAQQ